MVADSLHVSSVSSSTNSCITKIVQTKCWNFTKDPVCGVQHLEEMIQPFLTDAFDKRRYCHILFRQVRPKLNCASHLQILL